MGKYKAVGKAIKEGINKYKRSNKAYLKRKARKDASKNKGVHQDSADIRSKDVAIGLPVLGHGAYHYTQAKIDALKQFSGEKGTGYIDKRFKEAYQKDKDARSEVLRSKVRVYYNRYNKAKTQAEKKRIYLEMKEMVRKAKEAQRARERKR